MIIYKERAGRRVERERLVYVDNFIEREVKVEKDVFIEKEVFVDRDVQ